MFQKEHHSHQWNSGAVMEVVTGTAMASAIRVQLPMTHR